MDVMSVWVQVPLFAPNKGVTNLRNKNLSFFLWSQIISNFSYNLISFAITYHSLYITGSSSAFAWTMALGILPKVIFYKISGVILDNLDKKRFFVRIDLIFSFLILFMLTMNNYSALGYSALGIFSFIVGALKSLSQPIAKTIVPAIVKDEDLVSANMYDVSNEKLARLFGPAISLYVLSIFNFKAILAISSFIYLISTILKSNIEMDQPIISEKRSVKYILTKSLFKGFNISFRDKKIAVLLLNAVVTQMFFHPFFYTIFPILFYRLSGSEVASINYILSYLKMDSSSSWKAINASMQLAGSIGVLISMFLTSKIKKGISLGIVGTAISGLIISLTILMFKVFSFNTSLFIFLLMLANIFLFLSFNIFTVFFSAYYQRIIDKNVLGDFVSNFLVIFAMFGFLGSLMFGYLAKSGWILPVIFLGIGSVLKILLHMLFIYLNRSENE